MEQKQCFKCGETLPLSDFYKHPAMKDGHVNKCKRCNRRDVRQNRKEKVDYYREYDKKRNRQPERKQALAEKNKRRRARSKDYDRAHNAVTRAIARGDLVRPEKCERCDATEHIQAHHDDHSKILDVMWLCPVCHAQRHRELGLLNTMDD